MTADVCNAVPCASLITAVQAPSKHLPSPPHALQEAAQFQLLRILTQELGLEAASNHLELLELIKGVSEKKGDAYKQHKSIIKYIW